MTSRSKDCSASSRWPSTAREVVVTRWPSSRRARPSVFTIFSSSSTRSTRPVSVIVVGRPGVGRQLHPQLRAGADGAARGDGAAEAFDDVLGDRQAEAGAGAPRREVWIEHPAEVVARGCRRRGRARRSPRRRRRAATVLSTTGGLSPFRPRPTAARALVSRLTSTVRTRSASVVSAPQAGSSSQGDLRGRRGRHAPRRGPTGRSSLTSAGARSKRIGRAKSSTSLTTRLSRSTSPLMSWAASRRSSAEPSALSSVRSAPLMIISGLRISWATTVDSRPSADSRSRCAASRCEAATDSVSALKVAAITVASSSFHAVAAAPPCG